MASKNYIASVTQFDPCWNGMPDNYQSNGEGKEEEEQRKTVNAPRLHELCLKQANMYTLRR